MTLRVDEQLHSAPGLVGKNKRVDHATCSHEKRKKNKHTAGLVLGVRIAVCVLFALLIAEQQGRGFVAMATTCRLPLLLRSRSVAVSFLLPRGRFSAAGRVGDEKQIKLRSSGRTRTSSSWSCSTSAVSATIFDSPLVTVEEVRWG